MKAIPIYNYIAKPVSCLLLLAVSFYLSLSTISLAQDESPLPGPNDSNVVSQPINELNSSVMSAPIPGNQGAETAASNSAIFFNQNPKNSEQQSIQQQAEVLPVSLIELQLFVETVKNSSSKKTEGNLNKYLSWLDTLIKCHNKLANMFSKQEDMSASANNERYLAKQLCLLKDQLLYLKAQALIQEKQWPDAINILVDIISAEPQSSLGQQAYKSLKESGFSADLPEGINKSNNKSQANQSLMHGQHLVKTKLSTLQRAF